MPTTPTSNCTQQLESQVDQLGNTDILHFQSGGTTVSWIDYLGFGQGNLKNPLGVTAGVNTVDGVLYSTIQAAHDALPAAGGIIILPSQASNPAPWTLTSVLTLSKSVTLILGVGTLTMAMGDPGLTAGAIKITTNNVTIVGQGSNTVLTQPAAQNVQICIRIGGQSFVTVQNLKFDWNDIGQTNASGVYSCIRSSAGASDLRVYNCEFTRGGDRAIDFRGSNRVWIENNYFHNTGLFTLKSPSFGNSVSVDVDGTTQSTDVWLVKNIVEQQGDAFAAAHSLRVHIIGNTIRGAADFGNTPTGVEAGIDASGNVDCEIIGNHVINTANVQLTVQSLKIGSTNYVTRNCQVEGNTFVANTSVGGLAATDPRVFCGIAGGGITSGQQENVGFVNNSFDGTRLLIDTVENLRVKSNSFHNILSSIALGIAFQLNQNNGSGAVTKNFVISGNTASTDNATLLTFLSLDGNITTPDACVITDNATSSGVTNDVIANAGFLTSAAFITRSNRTIGAFSNAQSSETIRNATFPDQIISSLVTGTAPFSIASTTPQPTLVVQNIDPTLDYRGRRLFVGGTTNVAGDFLLGGNWGTSPSISSINNNSKDQAGSITILSGTGSPGANPTITLTFHDGTWGGSGAQYLGMRADQSLPLPSVSPWVRTAISTTAVTFTFIGTPNASTLYTLEWLALGH